MVFKESVELLIITDKYYSVIVCAFVRKLKYLLPMDCVAHVLCRTYVDELAFKLKLQWASNLRN